MSKRYDWEPTRSFDGCCFPNVKWQWAPDRRPERENAQSPPVLYIQGGSGRRRMPVKEWSDQGGEYSCRRSERQAGVEEVIALKQRHAVTGNSSVGGQPVGLIEYRCDAYSCRGVRTTSWGATLGLSEMHKRRNEEDRPRRKVSKNKL